MKPTITNAFNDGSAESRKRNTPKRSGWRSRMSDSTTDPGATKARRRDAKRPQSPGESLSSMQVDLRETEFGWSLELSPMHAIDALAALDLALLALTEIGAVQYLVSMEQSSWRAGDAEMPLDEIARRLAIPAITTLGPDQLVLDKTNLHQLLGVCQPSRLVAVAVEGMIDARDAAAMNKAMEAGRSPLLAELRAVAAVEVLGDRSIVLHCRSKAMALALVADNFRHYLAALQDTPAARFEAPEPWQVDRLLGRSGMMTVRPIETQRFSTSIDVGVNTSKERFTQPADRSLIYDIPSNTWHDEP